MKRAIVMILFVIAIYLLPSVRLLVPLGRAAGAAPRTDCAYLEYVRTRAALTKFSSDTAPACNP